MPTRLQNFQDIDYYLVVPAANASLCMPEIAHIEAFWATSNNLKLNHSKSKEIVFTARGKHGKTALPPPPSLGCSLEDHRIWTIKAQPTEVHNDTITSTSKYRVTTLNGSAVTECSVSFSTTD